MSSLCIIGEKELITGFKLVGVNDTFMTDSVDGAKLLRELFGKNTGYHKSLQ